MKTPTDGYLADFESFLRDEPYIHSKVIRVGRFLLSLTGSPKYEIDELSMQKIKTRKLFFSKIYSEYKESKFIIPQDITLLNQLSVIEFQQIIQDSVYNVLLDFLPKTQKTIKNKRKYAYHKKNGYK